VIINLIPNRDGAIRDPGRSAAASSSRSSSLAGRAEITPLADQLKTLAKVLADRPGLNDHRPRNSRRRSRRPEAHG
jgi:hypothetical protein